jgi:hypothetical protein
VRSRTNLVYGDDQAWVPTKTAAGFILEDGAGAEYGTADFIARDERRDEGVEIWYPQQPEADLTSPVNTPVIPIESLQVGDIDDHTCAVEDTSTVGKSIISHPPLPIVPWQAPLDEQQPQNPSDADSHLDDVTTKSAHLSVIVKDYSSPAPLSDMTRRHESGRRLTWDTSEDGYLVKDSVQCSPATASTQTPDKMDTAPMVLLDRDAFLMQHFTQKLAPWMDCCDPARHFAQEVPRRALYTNVLLYAVLALSSRHLSLTDGGDTVEASFYHGRCMELMTFLLSNPATFYDDNLVATLVCMRTYEELDEKADNFIHLQGIGRLLHAVPTFAHSGGLAEAASWQALRQDIYVAVRNETQPSFDLDTYNTTQAFEFRDDSSCAKAITLIFGRLLRLTYSPTQPMPLDAWRELEHHVELWNTQRSRIFRPLFMKDANVNENQPFPIIRLINPAQVVALQYRSACIVLLRQHRLRDHAVGSFEAVKERRIAERELIAALGNVIGLAESNAWVGNANFTAHHMLRSSAYTAISISEREFC